MPVAIPGRQGSFTGAKELGGSVLLAKNNPNKCHLYRDMGGVADGNRKTWTISMWIKRNTLSAGTRQVLFSNGSTSSGEGFIAFDTDDKLYFGNDGHHNFVNTDTLYRDTKGWYHIIWAADTEQASANDRWKIYVNGDLVPASDYGSPGITEDGEGYIQFYSSQAMDIALGERERGKQSGADDEYPFDGQMCDVHFIDGQQNAATDFGFIDPLTGNWRPKAYTGTYGTYGFYLPCDGSAPVGEDQSGNNMDFISYNFAGSTTIDKATGALPILKTVNGGTEGTVGVRTDAGAPGKLILALPCVGAAVTDVSPQLNGGTTAYPITVTGTKVSSNTSNPVCPNYYRDCLSFDGSGDRVRLNNANFVFGTSDFTIEAWVYKTNSDSEMFLSQIDNSATGRSGIFMGYDGGQLWIAQGDGSSWNLETQVGVFPLNIWVHVAVCRDYSATKTYYYINGEPVYTYTTNINLAADNSGDFIIGNGGLTAETYCWTGFIQDFRVYDDYCKYNGEYFIPGSAFPGILHDSPSGSQSPTQLSKQNYGGSVGFGPWASETGPILTGNAAELNITSDTQSFTIEAWINPISIQPQSPAHDYRYTSIFSQGQVYASFGYTDTGVLRWYTYDGTAHYVNSHTKLIELGTWQHVACVSNSGAIKLYHNGIEVASGTLQDPNGGQSDGIHIGNADLTFQSDAFLGYMSNLRVTTTAVYTSEFTPSTQPLTSIAGTKLLCCQDTEDATAAQTATSGLSAGGNVSASPCNPFNDDINIAQGETGNAATLNVLDTGGNLTIARGALRCYSDSGDRHVRSTWKMPPFGKWYWEMHAGTVAAAGYLATGLYYRTGSLTSAAIATSQGRWITASGNKGGAGGSSSSYGGGYDDGDYVSIAVDMDNGKIFAAINGVWCEASNPVTGVNAMYDDLRTAYSDMDWYPVCANWQAGNVGWFNFGQRPFRFTPPKGYQPLTSTGLGALANSADRQPGVAGISTHSFQVISYTGTGSSDGDWLEIPTGFQSDFTIVKERSSDSTNWQFFNTLVATEKGGDWPIACPSTGIEYSFSNFTANKHSINFPYSSSSSYSCDTNSETYIAYAWKAGGNKGTFNVDGQPYASMATAGITNGDIDLTGLSLGTKEGFSIGTFTGEGSVGTVATGLSKTRVVLLRCRDVDSVNWVFYHNLIDNSYDYMYLNLTNANANSSLTHTMTTTFKVGTNNDTGADTKKYLFYAWEEVPGFSKFGTYEGNNSSDGTFVETGFEPALIIIKKTSGADSWCVMDNKRGDHMRGPFAGNVIDQHLRFDTTNGTYDPGGVPAVQIDILSNGFKNRENNGQVNNGTYIYMAFAQNPLNNLYGGQVNAR